MAFIGGGSGGVGSCTWGALRDLGNIIRLRVVTMEEEPRVLEFRGEELARTTERKYEKLKGELIEAMESVRLNNGRIEALVEQLPGNS